MSKRKPPKNASGLGETEKKSTRYGGILSEIFHTHWRPGMAEFEFERTELERAAAKLEVKLPKNLGDLIYTFRYRTALPDNIARTASPDREWLIFPAGRARYRMALTKVIRIVPSTNHFQIKIPDATPQIIATNSLSDEQALLAKVRYNRLVDTFLRVTAYSLQNHLRTTVPNMGQIETDEVYVGVRNTGQQFVIPVQAKGGNDHISVVQVHQDLALCRNTFSALTARPVAVQFKKDDSGEVIVMFELATVADEIKVVDEKHYRLVPSQAIAKEDLDAMASHSG